MRVVCPSERDVCESRKPDSEWVGGIRPSDRDLFARGGGASYRASRSYRRHSARCGTDHALVARSASTRAGAQRVITR